ncbi:glycosyltransferase family 39 protein [Emcibacter sp.]|uniref:glycosyltransferase family 39 protein n=1 Tax=Emcibacter sp. TaxID=1979954 RepID=UPI002AA83631|nr:glycosyltransferase family 39 protein [Emcibacter sp.]
MHIEPFSDYRAYMRMATSLLENGRMNDGMGNVAYYSSGWPIFLSPFFAVFGATAQVAQILNVILGTLGIWLVYLCARQLLGNWKWAMLAALAWALYPPAILYTEYVAKENLMVPMLLAQTYFLLIYPASRHKIRLSVLLGALFAYELLVGPAVILTGLLIGLMVSGIHLNREILRSIQWKAMFACLIAFFITLAPWFTYTTVQLGKPLLNTNGAFNIYLGNNPAADVKFVGIQHTPLGPVWDGIRKERGEIGSSAFLKEQALNYVKENPGRTAWLSLRKIAYFWKPPIHSGEEENPTAVEKLMRLGWLIAYNIIVILALVPLLFRQRLNRNHAILFGTVALYCLIHAAAYVIFRYRLPVMPLMCILAANGLYLLTEWWKMRRQTG